MNHFIKTLIVAFTGLIVGIFYSGCGGSDLKKDADDHLIKITLQTDWYAQPEHGGFYQALVKGYYREAGLDVKILPGGPNAVPIQKVAQGAADFAIGRSDEVIMAVSRKVPLMIAGALMQHDPQAILFHKESGIKSFKDLDGKTVMATPGSAFIRIMESTYDIDVNVMPLDFGMNRFLADKNFIQQCFITNEPYYVTKEGANPGTLLLSDSGFSPYRVWYTSKGLALAKPEIVKAFSEASIRGWNDYLTGDRSEANAVISGSNPQQTPDFMAYVVKSMLDNHLVTGDPEKGEATGRITKERIQRQIDQLTEIGMLETNVTIENVLPPSLLEVSALSPPEIQPTVSRTRNLQLISNNGELTKIETITPEEMAAIAVSAKRKFFETDETEHDMTIVYLKDFVKSFVKDRSLDFWIMNCGDKYQSNFTPDILDSVRPYFVLTVDGLSIVEWLDSIDHPEWGPHVVNIESNGTLLDPPHKNPWGVVEMVAVTKAFSLKNWGDQPLPETAREGREIFINSCASCHQTGNGLLGGAVSTRTLQMLANIAIVSEDYFRKMLVAPKETNPLAEKMPGYAHYTEGQIQSLIDFLRTAGN